ncbi:MoaD/ThiS family protein [Thermococcus sp. M39]|uniref:MoaD/ThiS family protein n=1 Tax=unclassified Thermococcus TaxID=2627626 RepID=UPI001439E147|nr:MULTISPECIES: MoaD/ThiS family protein [unclassified Thermococcus]NJE07013.1 MoaD/ThiS family protein [Thermococcus sp. M39]NJE12913.1 MoaD/ThiS family protein [Thermococcus sp. LS2]
MKVRIRMYGELALKFSPEFDIEIEEGSTVEDLLRKLKISAEEHHILVNERKVEKNYKLKENDYVKLLPVVYGGYSPGP